jgi:hypothetical protein
MSGKIILGLVAITLVAAIPVITNVSKNLQAIPQATPLDISKSINKLSSPDISAASQPTPGIQRSPYLYFVALGDKGKKGKKIGCDDSLIPVTDETVQSGDRSLKSKYTRLFSISEQYYGNTTLYNALANSNLALLKSEMKGDGTQVVHLTGSVSLGGTCDTPRVMEQITAIAQEESPTGKAEIYLNGKTLQSALSQQ